MPKKYKNQYRIESNRLPGWDYSNSGYYFITIVTRNRLCNLGKIVMADDRAMVDLSDFGKIVDAEWKRSFEMREELFCAEYIVMPNHLHAIIVLERKPDLSVVETHGRASLPAI